MKDKNRISVVKIIWGKIRLWQYYFNVNDAVLAKNLDVGIRTLKDYDNDASFFTLIKLDQFLYINNMNLQELLSL